MLSVVAPFQKLMEEMAGTFFQSYQISYFKFQFRKLEQCRKMRMKFFRCNLILKAARELFNSGFVSKKQQKKFRQGFDIIRLFGKEFYNF